MDDREGRMNRSDDTLGTARGRAQEAKAKVEAATATEDGPLGPVDPVDPGARGGVSRPAPVTATAVVVAGMVALIATLVALGSIAEGVRAQEVFALLVHGVEVAQKLLRGDAQVGSSTGVIG